MNQIIIDRPISFVSEPALRLGNSLPHHLKHLQRLLIKVVDDRENGFFIIRLSVEEEKTQDFTGEGVGLERFHSHINSVLTVVLTGGSLSEGLL